jgi:tRNA1Val (adenine37-N6)-methyltransferase
MTDRLFSRDLIYDDRTVIKQRRSGYRFSVDALLLAWFVFRHTGSRRLAHSLELGAGSGVVSILLKRHGLSGQIDCVEREAGLFFLLKENIETNALSSELAPVCGDLRALRLSPEHYDIVFFNPPYHPPAAGRTSPDGEKAAARHELFGTMGDFLRVGNRALKKNGRLFFVHPAERAAYAYTAMAANGLTPLETVAVREHETDDPAIFLYSCVRGAVVTGKQRFGLLTMKNSDGTDTVEGKEVLHAQDRGPGI